MASITLVVLALLRDPTTLARLTLAFLATGALEM
jgi:hypothetical protein